MKWYWPMKISNNKPMEKQAPTHAEARLRTRTAPILKWVGGKRQLIEELIRSVPDDFGTYHEFFFGGGALFFELCNSERIDRAYLSDLNPNLMNLYQIVKEKPYDLIEELRQKKYANRKRAFYRIRDNEPVDKVQRAARFVYLNKTSFNGLYRENSKGRFNVPFGKYRNPKILNEESILAASEAFSKARLLCGDFSDILKYAKPNDFAYFDPPYSPTSKSSFTKYTKSDFGPDDQIRLKEIMDMLKGMKTMVLLSNSYTNFITSLYSDYSLETVYAKRAINCKADGRGEIAEILARGGY